MNIISQEDTELSYVLLTVSTAYSVSTEYFSECPDLKLNMLLAVSEDELRKQGILGYALCTFNFPSWTLEKIRCYDAGGRQVINDYIRAQLNNYYSKH